MSVTARAVKEIIYDVRIEEFNRYGLFADLCNIDEKENDMFDLRKKDLKIAKEKLKIGYGIATFPEGDIIEAKRQIKYYLNIMKTLKIKVITFYTF